MMFSLIKMSVTLELIAWFRRCLLGFFTIITLPPHPLFILYAWEESHSAALVKEWEVMLHFEGEIAMQII